MIGNQNRTEEVEARGKGEHSYYKWKGSALCGVEESVMQWRSDKGSGGLQKGFYRGMGFCGVMGS